MSFHSSILLLKTKGTLHSVLLEKVALIPEIHVPNYRNKKDLCPTTLILYHIKHHKSRVI